MVTELEKQWQDFYWSGFYAETYNARIDFRQRTQEEVNGILELLQPTLGSHILDWCGGWGRHSIELAKRGYQVTLLDFAPNHIRQAFRLARRSGVNLGVIGVDFRQTPEWIQADYAVNLFTSGIGYYPEKDDLRALKSLHRALKPDALFLIDTQNLFWIARHYQANDWFAPESESWRIFEKRTFNFWENVNHSEITLCRKDKDEQSHQKIDHRIYAPAELAKVLRKAGFEPLALYGSFDGRPFDFDSKRIIMVCRRVGKK